MPSDRRRKFRRGSEVLLSIEPSTDMMLTQRLIGMAVLLSALMGCVTNAFGQNAVAPPAATGEEVEPRIIGHTGMTLLGVSGTMSRFFSTEQLMAGTYTV